MNNKLKELTKATRIIFLVTFSILLLIITRMITGHWLPSADAVWFQFALLLVVLGSFFIETYFTRPSDVVVNSIAVLVEFWGRAGIWNIE